MSYNHKSSNRKSFSCMSKISPLHNSLSFVPSVEMTKERIVMSTLWRHLFLLPSSYNRKSLNRMSKISPLHNSLSFVSSVEMTKKRIVMSTYSVVMSTLWRHLFLLPSSYNRKSLNRKSFNRKSSNRIS